MPGFFLVFMMALAVAILATWRAVRLSERALTAEAAAGVARRQAEGRGRCLGMVSRELQGPALALLAEAPGLPAPAGERLTAAAQRMLRLGDDIADYLAGEAGERRLATEEVSLAPLLDEALAQVSVNLGPVRRDWHLDPGFAGLVMMADRRALLAALTQVLDRAARLTREGDVIDLRPLVTEDSVTIIVEDEGAGLPVVDLVAGMPAGTRGLGPGLLTARSLLEAHGGSLRMEALPGVGARAWISLPRERLVAG